MRKERNRFPRKFQSVEDLPRPVAELVFQHLPPGVIRLIVTICLGLIRSGERCGASSCLLAGVRRQSVRSFSDRITS